MKRPFVLAAAVLLPVILGTGWAGEERRDRLGTPQIAAMAR